MVRACFKDEENLVTYEIEQDPQAHPWRPRDELTVKLGEEGGDEVAQRVTAARVRLEFRRGGAPAARLANGAAAVSIRARRREGDGAGGRRGSPAPPFITGAW